MGEWKGSMEKSCEPYTNSFNNASNSSSSAAASSSSSGNGSMATSNHLQNPLRMLNKASHKISKPVSRPPLNPPPNTSTGNPVSVSVPIRPGVAQSGNGTAGGGGGGGGGVGQPQPPVYNIDKSDFRDVVQRLTGSPAHHPAGLSAPATATGAGERTGTAQQVTTVMRPPNTSRLHKIRPPPLAALAPRAAEPQMGAGAAPYSPLPAFPGVSAAMESPITAYMRRLRGEASPLGFGCLPSPGAAGAPLGFGWLASPGSGAAAVSPTILFPTSPGPVASPRWGDL